MEFIDDSINLDDYRPQFKLHARVRAASEFFEDVEKRFRTKGGEGPTYPSMLMRKVRSGVQFRPAEVTLWGGYNGHRKSMFTSQVALDLCVQRERVLMISLEMMPAETIGRMTQQAAGVSHPSGQFLKRFHDWSDGRLWIFDHVGRIDTETCNALCRYFAQALGGTQVFIDSMMMVCESEEHLDQQKQFATDMCRLAQETGLHVHVIAHCRKPPSGEDKPPTKYDIKGSGSLSDQAHNVVTVWSNKAKKAKLDECPHDMEAQAQADMLVTWEKQRNGAWEGRLKFWFHEPSLRFCEDRVSECEPYVLGAQ